MIEAYLQVSGVPGNSADKAHPGWIELHKLVVEPYRARRPVVGVDPSLGKPIRVHVWTLLGSHEPDLNKALHSGAELASAVIEIMKSVNKTPVVKQRIRMKGVQVMAYDLNRDPGLKIPTMQFSLAPTTYSYEVGSALQTTFEHEQAHASG